MAVVIIDSAEKSGLVAGTTVRGEFQCAACGYGIVVHRALPECPMCHGADWRSWSSRRVVTSETFAAGPLQV
jgi:Zn finger protein HypA/HybF involved in hydrogenase expression